LVGLQQGEHGLGFDLNGDSAAAAAAQEAAAIAAAGDGDTIAAIVTGSAAGAVSIIRLSGVDAVPIAQQVFQPAGARRQQQGSNGSTSGNGSGASEQGWQPESHRVYYGRAVDSAGGVLDEVCGSWWKLTTGCLFLLPPLPAAWVLCSAVPAAAVLAVMPTHPAAHTAAAAPAALYAHAAPAAQVLLLTMLEPRSYTAEDVIEIHTHGGGISAQRVLQVSWGPLRGWGTLGFVRGGWG